MNLNRAILSGVVLAGLDVGIEGENGKEAIKDGAVMAGSSIASDLFVNRYVSPFVPAGTSKPIADGLVFTGIQAFRGDKAPKKCFMNFIVGVGSSYASGVFAPAMGVAPSAGNAVSDSTYAATYGSVAAAAVSPPIAVPQPGLYASA